MTIYEFMARSILALGLSGLVSYGFAKAGSVWESKVWKWVAVSLSVASLLLGGFWFSLVLLELVAGKVGGMSVVKWLVVIFVPITIYVCIGVVVLQRILNYKALGGKG